MEMGVHMYIVAALIHIFMPVFITLGHMCLSL